MLDKARVILADDRAAVRSSLRLLLDEELAYEVVAEAADALGVLQVQAQAPAELILIDWELPGLSLPQLLHLLRCQRRQLLIIAMSSDPANRQPAIQAGADAFVDKSQAASQVLATLRALCAVADRPASLTEAGQLPKARPSIFQDNSV